MSCFMAHLLLADDEPHLERGYAQCSPFGLELPRRVHNFVADESGMVRKCFVAIFFLAAAVQQGSLSPWALLPLHGVALLSDKCSRQPSWRGSNLQKRFRFILFSCFILFSTPFNCQILCLREIESCTPVSISQLKWVAESNHSTKYLCTYWNVTLS